MEPGAASAPDVLALFQPPVRRWFEGVFPEGPTPPQRLGWPALHRRESTLILSPTGSGKTLTAFLACLDRLLFSPRPPAAERCRVLYLSPLKALAVDVERNLRQPLAGIAEAAAAMGVPYAMPTIATRTGDTAQSERARFRREPADILITTPESLFLMLTSQVRELLRSVDTVIVDEIHALVPTKRGAHLALSLERLESLAERPIQRIGLSATQRPLEEVARFLGGAEVPLKRPLAATPTPPSPDSRNESLAPLREGPVDAGQIEREFAAPGSREIAWRKVTVVDAGRRKALDLSVELPAEELARTVALPDRPAPPGSPRAGLWEAIHPRLLDLIRTHGSTLVFVNNRRTAERLAGALNDLAGEVLVHAHHGSIARAQRVEIEEALKAGRVKGLVATSSLELGIDMGSIDLVVQIEAPPSVAAGLQRIGRAGHRIGAPSRGIVFPKFRGDLLACAALTRAMHDGLVESSRFPRNPLDVLAQQLVAMVGVESWQVEALHARLCGAAPFAGLSRSVLDGVLDLLSGRYASDAFADLRPRLTWDRVSDVVTAREGAKRLAIANAGTIPDRGLFGVFLADAPRPVRVGELDEEMVFESRVGETFVLGASTWRIAEITHDRVLVHPAPGEPGKMPFWRGDQAMRPLEMGQRIGELVRTLRSLPESAAEQLLVSRHELQPVAAAQLVTWLREQEATTGTVPDDRTVVIERCRDESGDWRICVLSPFGGQVLAPWSMVVSARIEVLQGKPPELSWTNDGFVVRMPASDLPPDPALFLPPGGEVERQVLDALGGSALFAAHFRECAGRALLLPRRRPGARTPLWQLRKRSSDLLAVASRHGGFPLLLETYRECLRDLFDLPALTGLLQGIERHEIRVHVADTKAPSPQASALLFGFVSNFLYDGDAPLAERRAQALTVDEAQLRELMGDSGLRELIDPDALLLLEAELQRLEPKRHARHADGLHDLLLGLGDLSLRELAQRCESNPAPWLATLVAAQRVVPVQVAGEARFIPVEDAARYRDALGCVLPPGLPAALLEPVANAPLELLLRHARTHGPFTAEEAARRLGMAPGRCEEALAKALAAGRLLQGAFRPGGQALEWCDPEVLRLLRLRSLMRLRQQVEPVEPAALGRFLGSWHGTARPRPGLDALLDVVERLQGLSLPASLLDAELLPARVQGYGPADLDALLAAGEVLWVGDGTLGDRDGRLSLFLPEQLPRLRPPPALPALDALSPRARQVLEALGRLGASFFPALHEAAGGGFPNEVVEALWELAWSGLVTNDTFRAVRARVTPAPRADRRHPAGPDRFRSRRSSPPEAEGRWSLVATHFTAPVTPTERTLALAHQLLARHGVVTREVAEAEGIPGGFTALAAVLRSLEDAGRVRRGYFVSGVGAMQFVLPPVVDLLRSARTPSPRAEGESAPRAVLLAACDPANPWGSVLPWPKVEGVTRSLSRAVGCQVVLVDGQLAAWIPRGGRSLVLPLPEGEPERSALAREVAALLVAQASGIAGPKEGLLIEELDGRPASGHPLAPLFVEAGFTATPLGLQLRRFDARRATPRLR